MENNSGSTTTSSVNPIELDDTPNVRRKSDFAWDHCTLVASRTLKYNCYLKVIKGGGINRMKAHLAKKKEILLDVRKFLLMFYIKCKLI